MSSISSLRHPTIPWRPHGKSTYGARAIHQRPASVIATKSCWRGSSTPRVYKRYWRRKTRLDASCKMRNGGSRMSARSRPARPYLSDRRRSRPQSERSRYGASGVHAGMHGRSDQIPGLTRRSYPCKNMRMTGADKQDPVSSSQLCDTVYRFAGLSCPPDCLARHGANA